MISKNQISLANAFLYIVSHSEVDTTPALNDAANDGRTR